MATKQQRPKLNCESILAIDDDPDFIVLLKIIFQKITPKAKFYSYDPEEKGRPDSNFNWGKYDLILLDYDLGGGERGLDWLRAYKTSEEFPTTVMLTAQGSEEIAVQAMRFGLEDYINKQKLSVDRLAKAVKNAMAKKQKQKQLEDPMGMQTTLFNKVSFYKKLREKLKTIGEDEDKHSFLLQINIDDYDRLYEKYGILAIDNLSSNMAGKIAKALTSKQYGLNLTRIGDSKIGLLVTEHADSEAGRKVGRAICKLVETYAYPVKNTRLTTTVSIGVVKISSAEQKPDTLLGQVDKACQQAGKTVGNSVAVLQPPVKKKKPKPRSEDSAAKAAQEAPEETPEEAAEKPPARAAQKARAAARKTNVVSIEGGAQQLSAHTSGETAARRPARRGKAALALADEEAQATTSLADISADELALADEEAAGPASIKKATAKRPAAVKKPKAEITAVDLSTFDLVAAVEQNRIQSYYQPLVALSEGANMFDAEFFQLTINLVDVNGAVVGRDALSGSKHIDAAGFGKLDRWMIRHGLGRLMLNKKENKPECGLFMRLSAESFANNELFDWMVKLIIKTKTSSVTSKVVFEISPPEFLTNKKIMQNFINKMRDAWGIAFSLYDVVNPTVLETCVKQAGFEFAKANLNKTPKSDVVPLVECARELGTLTVIENVADAEQLNQAVVIGCDYAYGDFIQPQQDTLASTNDAIEL